MQEIFLQYIWQHQLFKSKSLKAVTGEEIEIINIGEKNHDAGPDFLNAKIRIKDIIWAGNIEIHKNSSDWFIHKHNTDKAYNNVILHVVGKSDKPAINTLKKSIPTIILDYDKKLEDNYLLLLNSEKWIPCSDKIHKVDDFVIDYWLNTLLVERLEKKSDEILNTLKNNNNNWEETFYQLIAKNFGFKLNALPFELLAKSTPLKYIAKHKNNLMQIEAFLFGQAGFLQDNNIDDNYYLTLQKEYKFLKHKFKLKSIEKHLWKFLRSRPVNFPTIRISQFAKLIHTSTSLFSKIMEANSVKTIYTYFDIEASEYWETHYKFGKISEKKTKNFGKTAINTIIINTVIPFLFIYGKQKGNEKFKEKAINMIEEIPAENNKIIRNWKEIGIDVKSAFYSQALIQLKNEYCSQKKCINCQIGNTLITNG